MTREEDLDPTGNRELHHGQEQPRPALTPDEEDDKALVQEVLDNYAQACSVESVQRQQEDDDLEFEGIDMWGAASRTSRSEQIDDTTGQKIPAKPTLTINLCEQRVQQVLAEARQARLGLTVQPKAGLANTKQASYYKGLLRSIQVDSGAGEVRLWALERAAKCGRGGYGLGVEYAHDGEGQVMQGDGNADASIFDLTIVVRRVLDQSTMYWDVYSQLADRTDADWGLLANWMSEKERLRRWPDKPILPPSGAFEHADHPWFSMDDDRRKSVLVVTYYKVIYHELHVLHHPQLGVIGPKPLAEFDPALQEAMRTKHPSVRSRRVYRRTVWQYILDGSQVLEKDQWLGQFVPMVPVTGKEYNVKGKRSWKGLVTNLKDLNRGYNVTMSAAVEAAGSMPRAPYIMMAGQDEGFEEMWDDSPIKAYTRLYIRNVDVDGKPAGFPQRLNQEPAIQGALLLARALKEDIGSVSGAIDPASKAVRPYDRSGKAIEALQRQGASGTSNYLDNLATVSMPAEGRMEIDLIPHVYDRPGRILTVMGEDHDEESSIMVKRPFVRNPDGVPVAVPCPQCQGKGRVAGPRTFMNPLSPPPVLCLVCQGTTYATRENMPDTFDGQTVEYVDFSEGQFKVLPVVGRNYQTQQEEAMAAMTELSQSAPALVPVYADLWVRAMGFSGSTEIADRIKKMNPHAQDDENAPKVPPEFLAKFQELQAAHEQAVEMLRKTTDALKTDQVKMEGEKALLAMKMEAAQGLEHLKQQGKLMAGTEGAAASKEMEQLKGELERMRQEGAQHHEVLLELLQARHAMEKERAANETKLAVAEETAKTDRMALFLEERARLGVDAPADPTEGAS